MTRKRLGTGDIRDAARREAKPLNDNSVSLPNPSAVPVYDRHKPIPSAQKALAFGMEPTAPKRLYELPRGDAGAGQTVYRKIHAFYSLTQPGDTRVGASNYTKALPIITMRSANQKPRYWHVSVYGVGVRRPATGAPLAPLSGEAIKSLQFEQYFVETAPGVFTPLSTRFVPSVPTAQLRVMVHDESGQRFFDADMIGNRSFSLYGFGATVFLLVKQDGYEADFQNPSMNTPLIGNDSGVEDDLIGGRVVGLRTNRTESIQNRTLTIRIDPAAFGGLPLPRIIPIPPGAINVQVFTNTPDPNADYELDFWYGRALATGLPEVGRIEFNGASSRTAIIKIPNAPSIAITPTNPAAGITNFSFVFEVEP